LICAIMIRKRRSYNMNEYYVWMNDDATPLPNPIDDNRPDDPLNGIYGKVCFSRGNIRVRVRGWTDALYAVFAGPTLVRTTRDVRDVMSFLGNAGIRQKIQVACSMCAVPFSEGASEAGEALVNTGGQGRDRTADTRIFSSLHRWKDD